MELLSKYWKYIVVLAFGVILGSYVTYTWFPRTVTVTPDSKVSTNVNLKDHTEIGYVPKVNNESTDVEVNKALPQVTVKVNGQATAFPLVQGETQKFQKGKVVLDQSTALSVDVTADVEKQVQQGIAKAFKEQARRPQYKLGIEGNVISADHAVNSEVNLRISRQSEGLDIDIRVNKDRQSISATRWF